jgi:hypothetical protein
VGASAPSAVIATQAGWYFFGLVVMVLTFFWVTREFRNFGMETVSMAKAGFICLAMGVILAIVIAIGMTAAFYGLIAMPFILGSTYRLSL